jgi:hypothetical protein
LPNRQMLELLIDFNTYLIQAFEIVREVEERYALSSMRLCFL